MVIVGVVGCFMIMILSWQRYKDLIAPPLLLSAIWLFMYIIMLTRRDNVDLSSIYYISFFVGLCFFTIGFFLIVGNKNRENQNVTREKKSDLTFNPLLIKVLVFAILILFLIYAKQVISFVVLNYSFNFWQTINIGRRTGAYTESIVISYSKNTIFAFTTVSGIIYFSNPTIKNKKYFFISLIIAIFFAVTGKNRGTIFQLILAIFFSYIIVKNPKNKKIFFILQIIVLIILTIFIISSFIKYVYQDQSNTFDFIKRQMRIYFSTSTLAFVQWAESSHDYLYGANTFRFLLAILNAIGYNVEVTAIVQPYIWVYGDITNVYTVLHYYAKDFGLIYAFIIQLLLGVIHGFFYKKSVLTKNLNPFYVAFQSFLYFPLINQFFDDKYFSIFSTWIQLILWIWLFTRRGLLKRTREE